MTAPNAMFLRPKRFAYVSGWKWFPSLVFVYFFVHVAYASSFQICFLYVFSYSGEKATSQSWAGNSSFPPTSLWWRKSSPYEKMICCQDNTQIYKHESFIQRQHGWCNGTTLKRPIQNWRFHLVAAYIWNLRPETILF